MDPLESAAEMIADDLIRMAKAKGVHNPDDVEVAVESDVSEVTEEMVWKYVREKWAADD